MYRGCRIICTLIKPLCVFTVEYAWLLYKKKIDNGLRGFFSWVFFFGSLSTCQKNTGSWTPPPRLVREPWLPVSRHSSLEQTLEYLFWCYRSLHANGAEQRAEQSGLESISCFEQHLWSGWTYPHIGALLKAPPPPPPPPPPPLFWKDTGLCMKKAREEVV